MENAQKFLGLVITALAWISLMALIWGIVLNWFPQASPVALILAGVIFALIGIVVLPSEKKQKKTSEEIEEKGE